MKFLSLSLIAVLLWGCSPQSQSDRKTLVYCSEGGPSAFNPQVTTDGTSNNAAGLPIYNRLVEFEYGSTKIIPGIAKSFEISSDQLTYTFFLRENVLFHTTSYFTPTRPLNAEDVLFSFERMHKTDHPYHTVGGGNYEYYTGMGMSELIESISAPNSSTIVIKLKRPEAPFLANMAMSFMSILSAEYANQLSANNEKEKIDNYPVGTGPFVFKKYVKDNIIKYDAFKEHFMGAPKIDQLIFAITPDASVRYQKLKTNECQIIIEPAPADLNSIKADPDLQLVSAPGINIGYLAMNTQKAPFDNKLVRQAINMALNKSSYINAIYLGQAEIAKNPIPPGLWSYNNDIEDYEYNPQKAKELLTQAGYPSGFSTDLWTLPVTRPYNPNGKKMGELMQADLAQIGIKVNLVSFDWPTYLKKSSAGEHTLLQLGWTGDNGDPDNFLHTLLGEKAIEAGSNYARWTTKRFEELVQKAKTTSDQQKRIQYYREAQVIFHEEAPWVPLVHSVVFRALRKNVSGYVIDPSGELFQYVEIKE